MQRSLFFLALQQLYPLLQSSSKFCMVPPQLLLVQSLSTSEARSSASASIFVLIHAYRGDLVNKPILARQITNLVSNDLLLYQPVSLRQHFWSLSSPKLDIQEATLEAIALGHNSLLSEKGGCFFVFQRAHSKPTWLVRDCSSEFYLRSDLERSHPLQNGKSSSISS